MISITTHTIVRNEENWLWYSLMSVKDLVSEMLVVDDRSSDKTSEIVKAIDAKKINFTRAELKEPKDLSEMRNILLKKTKTEWFLILDGDEIWNRQTLVNLIKYLESVPKETYAVMMRTRNCVGDVFHYLPESSGRYAVLGIKGNLNIRAYRKLPGFSWQGDYPLEYYADQDGKSVNAQNDHLRFFDDYYWHMTFLPRSSSREVVKGWRGTKKELGISVKNHSEFPEVFSLERPEIVPSPWKKMTMTETLAAAAITPLKKIRRAVMR